MGGSSVHDTFLSLKPCLGSLTSALCSVGRMANGPYSVLLDPQQAQQLAQEGAALLFLGIPAGSLVGIDHRVTLCSWFIVVCGLSSMFSALCWFLCIV